MNELLIIVNCQKTTVKNIRLFGNNNKTVQKKFNNC